MAGPLAGVRVVDLTTVGPGARCAALLADLGAEIVKVGPPASANRIVAADWAYSAGRGLRRIGIDLKDDRGREALLALAATADVFVEGFRPGVAGRLGIGYEDVRKANETVVYASLTGYGQDGPYARWAGHDINYQAVGGALAAQGRRPDGGPAIPGATWADSAGGGMQAALSICAALVARERTGEGTHLDVAAVDGVLSCMSLTLDEYLATGREEAPGGSILTGRYACYDVYECADGKWVSVGAIEPQFWANLCRLLGLEDLAPLQKDDDRQDEVRARVAEVFRTRPRDEWVEALAPKDTCVAPVLATGEVVEDVHLLARGAVTDVEVDGRIFRQTARVVAGAGRPERAEQGVPTTATDAHALLAETGFDDTDISALEASGAIR